jgi:hypothetical protein
MAKFEEIETTDLLKRIRAGRIEHTDGDAISASNFAYFLRPHLEELFERYQIEAFLRDDPREVSVREKIAEVVLTGLQLAIEHQVTELEVFVQPTEKVAVEQ